MYGFVDDDAVIAVETVDIKEEERLDDRVVLTVVFCTDFLLVVVVAVVAAGVWQPFRFVDDFGWDDADDDDLVGLEWFRKKWAEEDDGQTGFLSSSSLA